MSHKPQSGRGSKRKTLKNREKRSEKNGTGAKRNRSVTETHSQRLITLSMKSQMQENMGTGAGEEGERGRTRHKEIKRMF